MTYNYIEEEDQNMRDLEARACAEPMSPIAPEAVEADLQLMAATCSVDMVLWDRFSNGVLSLLSTLQAVRGENERLREALEPFAEVAVRHLGKPFGDAHIVYLMDVHGRIAEMETRLFRAARQALSTIQNGGGEGGLSQSQPSGAGPSGLAGPQPQHFDEGREP